MSRIRLKASSRSAEAGGSRAAWLVWTLGLAFWGYTTPDMQIHWENLAALCGFDSPGRKQAAALAVSWPGLLSPPRAMLAAVPCRTHRFPILNCHCRISAACPRPGRWC